MPTMRTAPWCVAASAMLFASASIASRLAPAGVPAALFGVVRLLLGGLFLAGLLGPRAIGGALRGLPRAPLAAAALAMALFQWSYFAAVERAGVGVASLVSAGASPLFADAFALARAGRRPSAAFLAEAALTVLGLAIAGYSSMSAAATGLSLVSALAYATYTTAAARLERGWTGGGLASTAAALVVAGLVLLPASGGDIAAMFSPSGLLVAAYLGLIATALAYALFVSALRRVSAAGALAILLIQPLAAVLFGATLLGEPISGPVLVAGATIALALAARVFP